MRSNNAIILSALAGAVTAGPCHANNCLRAVRATQFPTRLNDCATNLAVTFTPPTLTVTSTAQVTTTMAPVVRRRALPDTDLRNPKLGERAADAAALVVERNANNNSNPPIPTYATACADFAAYSSACSCAGATPATVTAPAPVTSTTVTATATVTAHPFQGCRNVRANGGTFEANFNRGFTYVTEGNFPYTDEGLDACCDLCVSKGNCLVFGIRVSSLQPNGRACEMFLGTGGQDLPNVSPTCPFGAVKGQVFGYSHSLDHIAQGPCFGMPPQNEWVVW